MKKLALALALVPSIALAEEQPPLVTALSLKLSKEIDANIACQAALVNLQREFAKLKEKPDAKQEPSTSPLNGSSGPQSSIRQ